jgi:hypothetical protein
MKSRTNLFLIICIVAMSLSACNSQGEKSTNTSTSAPAEEVVLEEIIISEIGSDGVNTLTYDISKWQPETGKTGQYDFQMLKHKTITDCIISPWLVDYPDTPPNEESITLGNLKYGYASVTVDNTRYDLYKPDVQISGMIPSLAVVIPLSDEEGCSSDAKVVLTTLH